MPASAYVQPRAKHVLHSQQTSDAHVTHGATSLLKIAHRVPSWSTQCSNESSNTTESPGAQCRVSSPQRMRRSPAGNRSVDIDAEASASIAQMLILEGFGGRRELRSSGGGLRHAGGAEDGCG